MGDHSQRILPVSVTPNIPSEQAKQVEMAPATLGSALKHGFEKRETCYRTVYGGVRCYNSGWYNWGRWLLLGLIIFFFIMTLCCLSWSSRRHPTRLISRPRLHTPPTTTAVTTTRRNSQSQ